MGMKIQLHDYTHHSLVQEDDAASTHTLPTMRFASNPAPATLGSHATANIFFDTTWEELSGDKV
jgi:hypothetical protein